jgi:hypothetical protein
MIAVVEGGCAEGPALRGTVLRGGGDWLLVGSDGVARLDIRATILTEESELIFMTSGGRVSLPDASRDRFLAGETVTAEEVTAHMTPVFETGAERFSALNATVGVGVVMELAQSHIQYRIYALD